MTVSAEQVSTAIAPPEEMDVNKKINFIVRPTSAGLNALSASFFREFGEVLTSERILKDWCYIYCMPN